VPKKPRDLADHDCLVFGAGVDQGIWKLTRDGKEELIKLRGKLITNDFDILHEAARSGLGLALISLQRAAPDLATDRLRQVLPEHCSPPLPIHAVYPSTRHLSPKVRAFIDFIAAAPGTPWQLEDIAAAGLKQAPRRAPKRRSTPSSDRSGH
jgi:DNA-binding transcriptional LysR family regulator